MYLHQLKGFERIPLAHYAVIQSQHGCRIKTLALGIHYQVNFNYRRELLGHFLLTRRCIACLEIPQAAGTVVRPDDVWQNVGGMNMCPTCFSKYTVRNDKLSSVPGLLKHLSQITPQSGKLGPWLPERCRPWTGQGVHWRPLVDDFTRQKCGLDSEMLLAKQEYFDWLRDTLRGQTSTVYNGRQTIRWDVIRIAQGYWSKPWPDEVPFVPPPNIQDLRNTVIPIRRLADFLFRPEKLDRNALSPQNLEGQWPDDPADIIRYQRDIPARTEQWKERKAKLMLCTCSPLRCMTYAFVLASCLQLSDNFADQLVMQHRSPPMGYALEAFHTSRLRGELTTTAIMARVAAAGHRTALKVYVTKLFLDTNPGFTRGAVLTDGGSLAARTALAPLAQASIGCLVGGCRARPRGVEEVVKHMRVEHAATFFTWNWLLA